jgi:hypothetical protein
MPTEISLEDVEAAARRLIDSKMESVRALVDARVRVQRVEQELTEAHRLDSAAYATAIRAGWTADELKKLDLAEPSRPPARPRAKPASSPRSRSTTSARSSADDSETANDAND